ncbi:hypothetical protein [Photobacterium alginatilyticum]|uniref:Uncharacterized protein n=1 Tax=Photobacterium alginatilyticum TaxID=1775171 RepID=A0ABW9YND5_9GAMM|nr:hypothetical protein [Photobacterium alginatilyticum]NBI54559.1 hypothetical protein [Photobacterium alginatilyticum]
MGLDIAEKMLVQTKWLAMLVTDGYEYELDVCTPRIKSLIKQIDELLVGLELTQRNHLHYLEPRWLSLSREENYLQLVEAFNQYADTHNGMFRHWKPELFPEHALVSVILARNTINPFIHITFDQLELTLDLDRGVLYIRMLDALPAVQRNAILEGILASVVKVLKSPIAPESVPEHARYRTIILEDLPERLAKEVHTLWQETSAEEREAFGAPAEPVTRLLMSLRDYLSACRDIYLSLDFDCRGLDLKACYRRFADGRDGGMLSLPDDDPEAFRHFVLGDQHLGQHPFEIKYGVNCKSNGLHLTPLWENGQVSLKLYASLTGHSELMLVKAYAANKSKWPLVVKQNNFEEIISGRASVGIWPQTHIAGLISPATTYFSFSETSPVSFIYKDQLEATG